MTLLNVDADLKRTQRIKAIHVLDIQIEMVPIVLNVELNTKQVNALHCFSHVSNVTKQASVLSSVIPNLHLPTTCPIPIGIQEVPGMARVEALEVEAMDSDILSMKQKPVILQNPYISQLNQKLMWLSYYKHMEWFNQREQN